MGLFTNPVTLNNGTARSFEFVGQSSDSNSMVGNWLESAAAIEINSTIVTKHDMKSSSIQRSLLQRKVLALNTASVLEPITINLTATYSKKHASATVALELRTIAAALAATNFDANFLKRLI